MNRVQPPLVLSSDDQTAFEQLADIALSADSMAAGVIGGRDIIAVPDLILVESYAQGLRLPAAPTLRRADGREVKFYALPEQVSA